MGCCEQVEFEGRPGKGFDLVIDGPLLIFGFRHDGSGGLSMKSLPRVRSSGIDGTADVCGGSS